MKLRTSLLFIMILMQLTAFAAEPREVTSTITTVTVYLRGAQVTRESKISIQKGSTSLLYTGLPVNIDPQSIQVKGEGNFIIMSMVHQINYLAAQRKNSQVKMLQDSLKIYEEQQAFVSNMLAVMNSEKEMLAANRYIGSTEKGVVVMELKQAADFYRARLTEINKEELRLSRENSRLQEKADRIRNQLNQLNASLNQPCSEIQVQVSADMPVSGNMVVTYTVLDAGWAPSYDIRASDVQSPVRLFYNANVVQNSGEDWSNVHVRLSTANPQQQGEKPNLQPWYIDFQQPVMRSLAEYNSIRMAPASKELMVADESEAVDKKMSLDEAITVSSYTEVNENQTNLEFNIKMPYDIPSDNKEYSINIQDFSLPAIYEYYCAPKIDREAFLLARITGWENYNLLSGDMNLFFEDTYVGKSRLNVRNTNDTLDLSLGRDKSIIVTRVKVKDFTEVKTMGSNKRETRAWEITVRNNKKLALDLRLEDQLPVSMNKDLEVEPIDVSGGKYNGENGIITWRMRLEPSAEKKIRVSYAIKYPKDKKVYIE